MYQTTLGNTISSDDSSRANGACATASTSPQQLLPPPLGDLGTGTAEDDPEDVGLEVETEVEAPDHRTTELGSMLIDSLRSGSAVHSNLFIQGAKFTVFVSEIITKCLCGRIVGKRSGLRRMPLSSSECCFPCPACITFPCRPWTKKRKTGQFFNAFYYIFIVSFVLLAGRIQAPLSGKALGRLP